MRIINIRIGKIYLYVHVDEQDGDVVTTDWNGKEIYNEILEQKLKVEKSVLIQKPVKHQTSMLSLLSVMLR